MKLARVLGIAVLCVLALGATAQVAHAQPADYFPINDGDTWKYRNTRFGGDTDVTVSNFTRVSWGYYAVFDNYWHDNTPRLMVYYRDLIYDYDTPTARFYRTYPLAANVGATFNLGVSPPNTCLDGSTGSVISRDETVTVPAGTFRNCITFTYRNSICADAGVLSETFAPGVGLIKRVENSFAGPVEKVLTEATVAGVRYPQAAPATGISVSVTLDKFFYFENRMPVIGPTPRPTPKVNATFVVKNDTANPIDFTFNSGQSFDVHVKGPSGQTVYVWSANKFFTQAIRMISLAPGDEFRFTDVVDLGGYVDGNYTLEFFLTADKRFAGTAVFSKSTVF